MDKNIKEILGGVIKLLKIKNEKKMKLEKKISYFFFPSKK